MKRGEGKTVVLILLLGLLIFISLIADRQLVAKIVGARSLIADFYFIEFSLIFTKLFIVGAVSVFLLSKPRYLVPWWVGAFVTMVIGYWLKTVVERPRPFMEFSDIVALVAKSGFSFPSVTTAVAFAALPIIKHQYKGTIFGFWVVFAVLVAFSRVYMGIHYVSDVLAGALLGLLIGKIALLTFESFVEKK